MPNTLWCTVNDPETNLVHQIGHPFPANDPDRRHFAQTEMVNVLTGNSYGRPTYQQQEQITEEVDICGYHGKRDFFGAKKEIPAPTLDDLEEKDEEWRKGYEARREEELLRDSARR